MNRTLTAWLVALLASMTLGCQEEFDPASRLTTLRILAIQSDPAAPDTGETTTLTPLIYTPPGDSIDSVQWSWCPFPGDSTQGFPCLISEQDLEALGPAAGDVPGFDLGTNETATLANSLDPELLATVCAGTPDQPSLLDCREGFPIQIKVVVRSDREEVTAVRQVLMRFLPEHDPNANPVIDGLVAEIDGEEQLIETSSGPTLQRKIETIIRAQVSEDQAETFETVDDFDEPVEEDERLILSWFTETGDVDAERTSFIRGRIDLDDTLENTWEPGDLDDYPRDTSEIIVVLRDSRGGVSWISGQAQLEDAP